ncbi:MAG: segregation/condensation protein A [Syntrophobacterales bacterium]|jgi:segregation and condensation protein A
MSQEYEVKLEIFEGPMDLLIHLIRKNKVEIYDIPIAFIMDQYLEYLDIMRSLNIDVAGEFLEMAATLAYIKSRMLVPRVSFEDEEDGEDPRMELVRPLLEYAKIKEVALALSESLQLDRDVYVRNIPPEELWDQEGGQEIAEVGLFELITVFQEVLKRAEPEHFMEMTADSLRLKDRIAQLMETLAGVSSITFNELFSVKIRKAEIIITFLAILELMRLQMVRAFQHQSSGIIRLYLAVEDGAMAGE